MCSKTLTRHGNDYRDTARVASSDELHAGRKDNARFAFLGQRTVARLVKLDPAEGGSEASP